MRRKARLLYILLALLMMAAPATGLLRAAGPFSWRAADAYVQEHLALKDPLISLHARLCEALWGETGNAQVIRGRDGWLFFSETMRDYFHRGDVPDAAIEGVADRLLRLSEALAADGARLVFLCAPNKNTIYPERMPAHLAPADGPDTLTRLHGALSARGVLVVDARAALLAEKARGPLYLRTDTHWNALGALTVYRALAEALALSERYGDLAWETDVPVAGDLSVLYDPRAAVTEWDARPVLRDAYAVEGPMRSVSDMFIRTRGAPEGPRLYVMRDSFGEALFPYLAGASGAMVFTRVYAWSPEDLAMDGADYVVLEIAERNLMDLLE
ncbi:hypothetical protein LJC74_05980 [Eubacteriales bacterium OttesenSCG-928-A19]|nr:hypothetical protein [Eubacteriales bacterium OttesenSCG-928-A19]